MTKGVGKNLSQSIGEFEIIKAEMLKNRIPAITIIIILFILTN